MATRFVSRALWAAALGIALSPRPSTAQLVGYDGFDYSPAGADLVGRGGGAGFSGPWAPGGFNASINTNYDVAAGSLAYGPLATSGNRAATDATTSIAGVTRPLTAPLGADGTTAYLSVLFRPEGQLGGGAFNGFFGITFESVGEPQLFIGKPGGGAINEYVMEDRGGSGQFTSGVTAVVGQTALLVLKAQFLPGNDLFTLYVNPTPGGLEPAFGILKNDVNVGPVTGLTIYSTGAFSIDELRLGNTFLDVTPIVPAPAAAVPLLLAAIALRRRRGPALT
jgi:hypothetical protein